MFVQVDYKQVVGEVKERNRFYKTLLEVKTIATESSSSQDLETCKEQLQAILKKCENSLEGII
jgi:hypothetical protein